MNVYFHLRIKNKLFCNQLFFLFIIRLNFFAVKALNCLLYLRLFLFSFIDMIMNPYTKKSSVFALLQFKMLGFVLLIVGVFYSLNNIFVSILFAIVGISLASLSDGIQIDYDKKLNRDYLSVLWMKFGKWHKMPEADYITVFIQNFSQGMNMVSITSNNPSSDFRVSIIGKDNSQTDAGLYKKREDAIKYAEILAEKFKVKYIDQTNAKD